MLMSKMKVEAEGIHSGFIKIMTPYQGISAGLKAHLFCQARCSDKLCIEHPETPVYSFSQWPECHNDKHKLNHSWFEDLLSNQSVLRITKFTGHNSSQLYHSG